VKSQVRHRLKKLIRRGRCKRCGVCCGGCPHLIPATADKPASCAIYENRPHECKSFPVHPNIDGERPLCGYYFVDAETGEVVRRRMPDRPWHDDEYDTILLLGYEPVWEETKDGN